MAQKRQDRDRFKYGICLNDDCPKCKSKEVQQISLRKEFVCEECGSELRECPPPKKTNPKPIIISAVVVVITVVVGLLIWLLPSKSEEPIEVPAIENVVSELAPEEPVVEEPVVEEPAPEQLVVEEPKGEAAKPEPKPATPKLEYGTWSGKWKNGKPHGNGTLRYSESHLIDSRDAKKRVADRGDYIVGEFNNGNLVQGQWYDSANNLKGSIILGM